MNFKTQFVNSLNNQIQFNPIYENIKNRIDILKYVNNEKVSLLNKIKTNKIYKIAGLASLTVILSLVIGLPMALLNNNGGDIGDSLNGDKIPFKGVDVYSLYGYYYQSRSFANVKVLEVDESLYLDYLEHNGKYDTYCIIKGEVIDDFYNVLDEGSIIYIPFQINYGDELNFELQTLTEWFFKQDSLCVYLNIASTSSSLTVYKSSFQLINENTNEVLNMNVPIYGVHLGYNNLIPIYSGKVDFDIINSITLDTPYDLPYVNRKGKHYYRHDYYEEYIQPGMEADVLFENLRRLYQKQLEIKQNEKERNEY